MKNNNITIKTYINMLPNELKSLVKSLIEEALISRGITDKKELKDSIEHAMDSRLCDLEDLIPISSYFCTN